MPKPQPKGIVKELLEQCNPTFKDQFIKSVFNENNSVDRFFQYLLQSKESFISNGKTEANYYELISTIWNSFPPEKINTTGADKNKTMLMRVLSYPRTTDEHVVLLAVNNSKVEGIDMKCEGHVNYENYAIVVMLEQGLKKCIPAALAKAGVESLKAAKEALTGEYTKTKRVFKDHDAFTKHYTAEEISNLMIIIDKRLGANRKAKDAWKTVAHSIRRPRKNTHTHRARMPSVSSQPPSPALSHELKQAAPPARKASAAEHGRPEDTSPEKVGVWRQSSLSEMFPTDI